MKKIIMTFIAAAALGASAVTVHRSFKNGYPAGSAPSSNTGASIGVNGAKLTAQDARPAKGKEKLKDDGTCWAVTAAGARCKNHKDGEKDYCKLHAADKRVKVAPARCRALTWEGARCSRAPEPGYNYCKQHGAPAPVKAPAPKK